MSLSYGRNAGRFEVTIISFCHFELKDPSRPGEDFWLRPNPSRVYRGNVSGGKYDR